MDQINEQQNSETTTTKSNAEKLKTAGETVVLAYALATAAVGFYQLGKEAKVALKERRAAKKAQKENDENE